MTAPFDNGDDPGQAQPPGYPPPPPSYPPPPPGYYAPPPVYPPPVGQYPGGYGPVAAPYGYHPVTGEPLSDKSKVVAGLLQLLGLLGLLGIGRMYMGHTGMGVAQLLVTIFTCGVGALWPFVDGIIILVNDTKDADGRMLRS